MESKIRVSEVRGTLPGQLSKWPVFSLIVAITQVGSADGPCVRGALPNGVQFARPFDGTTHRKPHLSSTFRIPGLLAHPPKTLL
jgi:hypothetical protein